LLWNADGLPDGKAEKYWLKAEKIIDHQDKLAADEARRAARASRERSSTLPEQVMGGCACAARKPGSVQAMLIRDGPTQPGRCALTSRCRRSGINSAIVESAMRV